MAAGTGYSKVSTNGLVFAYDIGDTRNSYIGEPTTNLLSSYFDTNYVLAGGEFSQYANLAPIFNTYGYGSSYSYSLSMDVKINLPSGGVYVYMQNGSSTKYSFVGQTINPTTTYQRFKFEGLNANLSTPSDTAATLAFYTGYGSGVNPTVKNVQVELKSHATPYVYGTRSNTQGLLDLSGRGNSITLNNSYDSNANFYFDGSDDYLDLTPSTFPSGNEISVEFVTAWDGSLQYNSIIAGGTGGNQDLSLHLPWSDGNVYWDAGRPFNRIYKYAQPSEYLGNHHWVCTKNANTGVMEIYLDGNLWHSGTGLTSSIPSLGELNIGRYNNGSYRGYYYKGNTRIAKIYNRALAAGEVRDNYSHYKTRFSLP